MKGLTACSAPQHLSDLHSLLNDLNLLHSLLVLSFK
jgi:hypothetical protein